jgi:GcrA cell cycle regulator
VGAGFWTEERVERLKKLVAEGHSFSAINVILGGPSRSAMIGKANRLGLCSKSPNTVLQAYGGRKSRQIQSRTDGSRTIYGSHRKVRDGKPQTQRIRDLVAAGASKDEICDKVGITKAILAGTMSAFNFGAEQNDPSIDIARKPLLDLLEGDCRWPVGDPQKEGFGFCAAPRIPGKPYCKGHLIRAERPIEEQPREIRIAARAERVKEDA